MNDRTVRAALAAVASLAAVVVLLLAPRFTSFADDDSAEYLEAADNFAAGRGFSVWPYGIEDDDDDPSPMTTFPPGYPFLIFLASRFGIDAWRAGILVPRLAFLLLPAAFFFALRGFLGDRTALVAAIVSAFLSVTIEYAMFAMSEIPFLLFTAAGFAALFRAFEGRSALFALAGGASAGVALAIKNLGYASPIAVVAGLAAAILFGWLPRRRFAKLAALYGAGCVAAYAPVAARGLVLFGSLQPYDMPPSDRTLHENLVHFAHAMKATFFGESPSMVVGALVLLVFLVAGVVVIARRPFVAEPRANRPEVGMQGALLALYAVVGFAVVVAARTRYYWGEEINPRQILPFAWVIVAWTAFAARETWARRRIIVRWPVAPMLVLFLVLLALPQASILGGVLEDMAWEQGVEGRARTLEPTIRTLPEGTALVSSWGCRLQLLYRLPVRNLRDASPAELGASPPAERNVAVILLGDDDWIHDEWKEARKGALPEGYRTIRRDGDVLVLFREKDGSTRD